jgi:hypothetical protein
MTSEKKRIYIVVKTYPTISDKYAELVCTAGILEDGSWIRLYPIPFRKLDIEQKYPKYTWINIEVKRNLDDFRKETYRPCDLNTIVVEPMKSKKPNWDERRRIIFKNKKIYTNLQELIDKAKSDKTSLAVFKPAKLCEFIIKPTEREWSPIKLEHLRQLSQQMNLFQTPEEIKKDFKVVKKVPYKFSYRFLDDSGKQSTLMIEDWEIGMLYFHCLERANYDESIATEKVRKKYFDEFIEKDLYFFLGTTKRHHYLSRNPFIIIGVFYPPKQSPYQQINLFDI